MKCGLKGQVSQAFLTRVINSCRWTNLVPHIWVMEARVPGACQHTRLPGLTSGVSTYSLNPQDLQIRSDSRDRE